MAFQPARGRTSEAASHAGLAASPKRVASWQTWDHDVSMPVFFVGVRRPCVALTADSAVACGSREVSSRLYGAGRPLYDMTHVGGKVREQQLHKRDGAWSTCSQYETPN